MMMSNLINRLNLTLTRCEQFIEYIFRQKFPPAALCTVDPGCGSYSPNFAGVRASPSLKDILTEGFLWGVPKHRRSLEKRMTRRFGIPEKHWKMLVPKTNLLDCPTCGHTYEAHLLCHHCYGRVKAETKEMQDAIQDELKLEPVEKNVIVLYEGEKQVKGADYWKDQRIVELPKKRPAWFHSNLMQPTTQEPAEVKDVKPDQLA